MPIYSLPAVAEIEELRYRVDNAETVTSGALSLAKTLSSLSVTGTQAYSLVAGAFVGQRKIVECTVAASTPVGTLTLADAAGSEPVTHVFHAVGQRLELEWQADGWKVIRKRRAGTKVAVIGTTALTGFDMALLYDCQVTGTVSSTGANALPDGQIPGEVCYTGCSVAASTPVGNINFTGSSLDGVAKTDLQAIGAVTDSVSLSWTGVKWLVVANAGITVA